jgi:hypothetical protein
MPFSTLTECTAALSRAESDFKEAERKHRAAQDELSSVRGIEGIPPSRVKRAWEGTERAEVKLTRAKAELASVRAQASLAVEHRAVLAKLDKARAEAEAAHQALAAESLRWLESLVPVVAAACAKTETAHEAFRQIPGKPVAELRLSMPAFEFDGLAGATPAAIAAHIAKLLAQAEFLESMGNRDAPTLPNKGKALPGGPLGFQVHHEPVFGRMADGWRPADWGEVNE